MCAVVPGLHRRCGVDGIEAEDAYRDGREEEVAPGLGREAEEPCGEDAHDHGVREHQHRAGALVGEPAIDACTEIGGGLAVRATVLQVRVARSLDPDLLHGAALVVPEANLDLTWDL